MAKGPNGSSEGFDFSGFAGDTVSAEEIARLMWINQARNNLRIILLALDRQLANHSKAGTIQAVQELLTAVRCCSKFIPAEIYDEITTLISGLQTALTTTDNQVKSAKMVKIEKWHASQPKFIRRLPELRQLVFS